VSDQEEANRRFYVRAVFALVEAVVEQHKRLLLDLAERDSITLADCIRSVLSERVYAIKDNGAVVSREQYLQLQRKLRGVYRAAGAAFGQNLDVSFGGEGWVSFQSAIEVRDRISGAFFSVRLKWNVAATCDRSLSHRSDGGSRFGGVWRCPYASDLPYFSQPAISLKGRCLP
jgi:hypothetical protein